MTVTVPALLRAERVIAVVPEARKAAPVARHCKARLVGLPGVGASYEDGRLASPRPGFCGELEEELNCRRRSARQRFRRRCPWGHRLWRLA